MSDQDSIRDPHARLPLLARDGSIKAVAVLDIADAARVITLARWGLATNGYVCGTVGGSTVRLHRVILGLDREDPRHVDHLNRDRLDNRRVNLRLVTQAENNQNTPAQKGSVSGYRGVDLQAGVWRARYGTTLIGMYDTELDAARAAALYRAKHAPFSIEDPELLLGDPPERRASRPSTRITPEQCDQVVALWESGFNQREAADELGLSTSTVSRVLATDPRVA